LLQWAQRQQHDLYPATGLHDGDANPLERPQDRFGCRSGQLTLGLACIQTGDGLPGVGQLLSAIMQKRINLNSAGGTVHYGLSSATFCRK
jgi:hypothetical protein